MKKNETFKEKLWIMEKYIDREDEQELREIIQTIFLWIITTVLVFILLFYNI